MANRNVSWSDHCDEHVIEDTTNYKNETHDNYDENYDRYFETDTNNEGKKTAQDNRPRCPNCGSFAIEQQDASGASCCTECGVVVEENMIVSSVDFAEGSGGSSSMVGQFVSATSSKAYTGGSRRGGYGYSRESREQTLQNARRRIQDVASRLRLGSQTVDAAYRLYVIALERNFVLGRKATHVTAACLYIACRQQRSQHMLIDFSDALQVNVYALGTTFLKFRRLLSLKLELIDPALYIYRFAAHLDLDESANTVAMTALRIVARMKRDWIQTGRRPAGICAAALLIASRAHGFQKHHNDVTKILRVCGMTVNNRVREFEQTASARLTLEQFHDDKYDFAQELDPPIFTKNRLMEARAKAIQEGNVELLESGMLDDPVQSDKTKSRWRDLEMLQRKTERYGDAYKTVEETLLQTSTQNQAKLKSDSLKPEDEGEDNYAVSEDQPTKMEGLLKEDIDASKSESPIGGAIEAERSGGVMSVKTPLSEAWKQAYPIAKYGKAIVLQNHATAEEQLPSTVGTEAKLSLSEWKRSLPAFVGQEMESIFRSDEEEKQKEAIFNKINADFIEQQKMKGEELNDADQGDEDKHSTDPSKFKRKYNKRSKEGSLEGGTTEEQLIAAVSNRKVSRKINYDALSSIFDEDGSFATDVIANSNPEPEHENIGIPSFEQETETFLL